MILRAGIISIQMGGQAFNSFAYNNEPVGKLAPCYKEGLVMLHVFIRVLMAENQKYRHILSYTLFDCSRLQN